VYLNLLSINGDNFELCDVGGKVFQLITTTPSITTKTTTTTTTIETKLLSRVLIGVITALSAALFFWAVRKCILWKQKRMAKKNGENNLILTCIDAVIDELEMNLITPATTTTTTETEMEKTRKIEKFKKIKNKKTKTNNKRLKKINFIQNII
jgi:hypothetical protein